MRTLAISAALLGICIAVHGQIRITNAGDLALEDLVEKRILVTVMLKGGYVDTNLTLIKVHEDHFTAVASKGDFTAYLFKDIIEIRVQGGEILGSNFTIDQSRTLRAEDQTTVTQAVKRAEAIFGQSDLVPLKLRAAALLASGGPAETRGMALKYLRQRLLGNDLEMAVESAIALYVAGDDEESGEESKKIARRALQSINRRTKARAALLAGLLRARDVDPEMLRLIRDRTPDLFGPAARGAGRLQLHAALPKLYQALSALNHEKGEAAVFALQEIGGAEVIEMMRNLLGSLKGFNRYRVARVLYALNDPLGREELLGSYLLDPSFRVPDFKPNPAFILARDGVADAASYLLDELNSIDDPNLENLVFRARAAAALVAGGHTPAVSNLQRLLSLDPSNVYERNIKAGERKTRQKEIVILLRDEVCKLAAEVGVRRLLPVMQPVLISSTEDGRVILSACEAVVAIADSAYRERLLESRL